MFQSRKRKSSAHEALKAENRRLKAETELLLERLNALMDENARLGERLEQSVAHKRFRYEALSYMLAHPDVEETTGYIAEQLLGLSGCDRIAVGGADGVCRTWTRPDATYPDCNCFHRCPTCPLLPEAKGVPDVLCVPDVRNTEGVPFPDGCLAKSVISLLVRSQGVPWCRLTLHYIDHHHVAGAHEMRSLEVGADVIATALERKRLVALQEAETALRIHALDKAPISVYIKDADDGYRYVFMNDFTLARLGLRREDVIGRTDYDFLPAATAESYRRNDEAAAATGDTLSTQESYVDGTGRTRHVQSFRCSARDPKGHHLLIGYSLDLTELLEKQSRIEALQLAAEKERDRAVAAERAKADFFASISHDIRTPLNVIIGFSELLENEPDPARRREYLDNIVFSGNTLLELVDDVLDLARLDAGMAGLVNEPFDFKVQAELVLRTFALSAREKGIALRLEADGVPVVELDGQRMRQLLFNLVGNAVKYTDAGGVTVSAFFERHTPDHGMLRVCVRDSGIGIAREDIRRLLEPYVRLRAANARGGTGLGLAICKRVVEAMGGEISISSEPGKGSVFAILLPDVLYREDMGAGERVSPPAEEQDASFAALRVLIVDDLEMNRRVLEAGCRRFGVKGVVTASSSHEALQRLTDNPFDLVLTDMKMPGMDGGDFIRAVRALPSLSGLPVFLVTADAEARKYYRDIGADGVLLKPVVLNHLAEAFSAARIPREKAPEGAASGKASQQ